MSVVAADGDSILSNNAGQRNTTNAGGTSGEVLTSGGDAKARRKSQKDKAKADKKKEKRVRAARQAIIDKQMQLLKEEINLDWRFVFGEEKPKKKKDAFVIKNVTRRNVWMEDDFLFNCIKSAKPDEFYHSVDKYCLKWQPPDSLFELIIPLSNPQTQENAIIIMAGLEKKAQRKILFHFTTIDPTVPLFAPKVHPASLVSYRTKNEVLKKLSDLFLEGRIDVDEIQAIFTCDQRVWSASLFNLLPEDEQAYHMYLNQAPKAEDVRKSLAKSYIDGDISLQQYADERFPDRKKKRDVEAMEYPLPYEADICRICHREQSGVVQCHTCANMVCAECFESVFVAPPAGSGAPPLSFLLMHQKYCMRLGALQEVAPLVEDQPAYLRQFRQHSKLAALQRLMPQRAAQVFEEEAGDVSEDDEEKEHRRQQREGRRRRQREEAEWLRAQNPAALQELAQQLAARRKRLEHLQKEIRDLDRKISDCSHTDQFIARNVRLKGERVEKLRKQVQQPIAMIEEEAAALQLQGPFIEALQRDVRLAKKEIGKLLFAWDKENNSRSEAAAAAATDADAGT